MEFLNSFYSLNVSIAGIALLSAVLGIFTDDNAGSFGFRTVCGIAVVLSVLITFRELMGH